MKDKNIQYSDLKISALINHHQCYISDVLIIKNPNNTAAPFQLLVINGDKVLANLSYATVRGARIAFFRMFCFTPLMDDVTLEWSHWYPPEKSWLDKRLRMANEQV